MTLPLVALTGKTLCKTEVMVVVVLVLREEESSRSLTCPDEDALEPVPPLLLPLLVVPVLARISCTPSATESNSFWSSLRFAVIYVMMSVYGMVWYAMHVKLNDFMEARKRLHECAHV
jgi:hypothetical protein